MEITQEKATFLPNPDAIREPIVPACKGCNKIYDTTQGLTGNFIAVDNELCIAYESPAKIQRRGCALQSNREISVKEKKKINPIKWSKRKNR